MLISSIKSTLHDSLSSFELLHIQESHLISTEHQIRTLSNIKFAPYMLTYLHDFPSNSLLKSLPNSLYNQ